MQGKIKEAANIYTDALKSKSKDPALVAVVSNNIVSLNKDQNVFDSRKKMRAAMSDACDQKLTSKQKQTIELNNVLLALYTNQHECEHLCTQFLKKYIQMKFLITLIRISQLERDKKYKEALEILEQYEAIDSNEETEIKFAIAQLMLLNGNKNEAINAFNKLKTNIKYSPGIISALVTLNLGMGNKSAASNVLKEAVEWCKKNKGNEEDLTDMWRQAADYHLRGGEPEIAAKSLEELLKQDKKNKKILAQLVIAYAQFNPNKAKELSTNLPKLETLTTSSDIDQLEAANWMMSKAVKKTTVNKYDQSPGTPVLKQKQKRKKNRKTKLPKNYNPNVKPDPERWLPKYERSSYRHRKRDRRVKEQIKGSQGVSSTAADQFDMTKNQSSHTKHSPATPTVETSTAPRQQRKPQQKKKKNRN